MPAPSAALETSASPAQHRTQFIRGVRDSMAKALAQGLGDPAPEPAPQLPQTSPPPPPPPVFPSSATRISITGRLKQLISSGERPGLATSDQLLRTPPRAAATAADQLLRKPPAPAATSLKPIVRLAEGGGAAPAGDDPNGNGDASEERKRMIALAQLKILQRKTPSPQKSDAPAGGGSGGGHEPPLKTYAKRPEAATIVGNGPAELVRKNVKLMPPLTLMVSPAAAPAKAAKDADLLKPDVEDASRCASGLLIRKTYFKVAREPAAAEVNGSPQQVMVVRRRRGRPRLTEPPDAAAPPPPMPPPPPPPLPLAVAARSQLAADSAEARVAVDPPPPPPLAPPPPPTPPPQPPSSARSRQNGSVVPNGRAAGGGRKRRHGSTSRSSDTSSGPSSADASPRPKKRSVGQRGLSALFMDEGAINILAEMDLLKGEKRRAKASAEKKIVYKPAVGAKKAAASSPPGLREKKSVVAVGKPSSARGKDRAVDKIKAKALRVKKEAVAKQAKKAAASKKAEKLKVLKQKADQKTGLKVMVKCGGKPVDAAAVKSANQKPGLKVVTKPNKSPSSATVVAKKVKTAAATQARMKKSLSKEKGGATNGKKSPTSPTVEPATKPAAALDKKKQPKITQDKNLNIIEKKSKDIKNGERKRENGGEKSREPSVLDKSPTPSSKSSKSPSPLPMPVESNPVPTSPSSLSYSSLQKRLELATLKQAKRKLAPEDRERASSRSNLGTVRHREICIKKFDRFHQVILCPVTTRLKAGLNVQVMRELREYLAACERDPACRAVLLTSSAGPFCQGLDYTCLLGLSPDKRRRAAEELARELKEFVRAVAGFSKPLLAGVTGACVGMGVGLLPLCDLVYVTEKATLQMPYCRLGTVPEGGATHSLTALLGHMKAGALMMTGRAMTGSEAMSASLATGLLWSSTAYEELIGQARQVLDNAAQIQALESTKALIRHSLRAKMEMALHSECRLLVHQWSAPEFQLRVRELYDSGQLQLQKPGFDTQ